LLDRYLLTFTMRWDGSSRFADGNRWGTFPSLALGWKLKEEKFLKEQMGQQYMDYQKRTKRLIPMIY
jgi:protein-S-isoprenylcysteine O-methyltransferase Ste14